MKNTEKYVFMVPARDRKTKTNKKLTKRQFFPSDFIYGMTRLLD